MLINGKRAMAWVTTIDSVARHPNADLLDVATVGGWELVVKRDEFQPGQQAIYITIDAWVPTQLAPFLSKGKEPRQFNEIPGERLRTARLRGVVSQGLLLPMSSLDPYLQGQPRPTPGTDVSDLLGITIYEKPEPKSADARGFFPVGIPKTDQERIQNCFRTFEVSLTQDLWDVEEKIEGQSHTAYFRDGEFGVASRSLDLRDGDNTFWNTARAAGLPEKLASLGRNLAIQSEQVGPGIQGNIYGFTGYHLITYDIFDIDLGRYLPTDQRDQLAQTLGLTIPPRIHTGVNINAVGGSMKSLIAASDGASQLKNQPLREGLIWRRQGEPRATFKAISTEYLLKQK